MTNPKVDIFTQFLRYPTVFGNTILKNFARDTINNPATNAPKVAAFVAMSTNVAKATNYWRTSEEHRERIDRGEDSWKDTLKAYQRVGLLGPIEYGVRFTEALAYGQNPAIATANLGGPVLNDIVGITLYNRGLLETGARKLPFIGTKNLLKRYTGVEPYTPIQEIAKEQDKKNRAAFEKYAEIATGTEERLEGFSERFNKLEGFRSTFSKGGRVGYAEGLGVSQDVSDVKNEPENRIDPFTGQPYAVQSQSLQSSLIREETQEQMSRLGFDKGGSTDNKEVNPISNKDYIYNKFVNDFGYRPEAAIGMLGNFAVESGDTFRHDIVQGELEGKPLVYTKEDIDKGVTNRVTKKLKTEADIGKPKKGYGIAQFDFMNDYYQDYLMHNNKQDSLDSQIEYVNDVIQGTDTYSNFKGKMLDNNERKKLVESLNKDNIENTTKSFMKIFEKPGKPHLEKRIAASNNIFQEYIDKKLFQD
jgi:hypothetical protein